MRKALRHLTFATVMGGLIAAALPQVAHAVPPTRGADFNKDGFADVAIGAPGEGIGAGQADGSVNVIYGKSTGANAAGDQLWHQDVAGVLGTAEDDDSFGGAVAYGDFNADGYSDLAAGVPFETIGNAPAAGAVNVLYGAAGGLGVAKNQAWWQGTSSVFGSAEPLDLFGAALASGDFNGDGRDDLAIGVPGEDVVGPASEEFGGAVAVLYGSSTGLSAAADQLWHQNSTAIGENPEPNDFFGFALVSSDINGDGRDDLAIGVPGESLGSNFPLGAETGAVQKLNGSSSGLSAAGNQLIGQAAGQHGDGFGVSVAAGDFNQEGHPDLAVGIPGRSASQSAQSSGAVEVFDGSADGLATAGTLIQQGSSNIEGTAEADDLFGISVAAGDFNEDGADDLAAGIVGEDAGSIVDAGGVAVVYGSLLGLQGLTDQIFTQDTANVAGGAESNDEFGVVLSATDVNGDGAVDLAVGSPDETLGAQVGAGAIHILYGAGAGLSGAGSQLWTQNTAGIEGGAESDDGFGAAL